MEGTWHDEIRKLARRQRSSRCAENLISKERIMTALSNATIGYCHVQIVLRAMPTRTHTFRKDGDDNQVNGGANAESVQGKDSSEVAQTPPS